SPKQDLKIAKAWKKERAQKQGQLTLLTEQLKEEKLKQLAKKIHHSEGPENKKDNEEGNYEDDEIDENNHENIDEDDYENNDGAIRLGREKN
ncbi:45923_t:CDS:2, partial [Gigaspora margarita]